jgi:hypothetical protein
MLGLDLAFGVWCWCSKKMELELQVWMGVWYWDQRPALLDWVYRLIEYLGPQRWHMFRH